MDRRAFLGKSFGWTLAGIAGFNPFAKAFAMGQRPQDARMAVIIDDIGNSFSRARQFLKLNIPITYAVLPRLVHSYDLAMEIHDKGHEIMLHLPMEPKEFPEANPGPGALFSEGR